ncbi:MAG: bifunctional isocitrate dehydrogenase kinase/phosphatase [Acidimicrobiales bacterium]|nr:bifunctional isocitrate dehydrogenase kinase/phosphatase [Acidimicrobiales bacterium]
MTIEPAEIAERIRDAFDTFQGEFVSITRRAEARFASREWALGQIDAQQRLLLHRAAVERTVDRIGQLLPGEPDREEWRHVRRCYADLISGRHDLDLSETFFNSVTRRVFTTIGVDEDLEFRWFGTTAFPRSEFESVAVATFALTDRHEVVVAEVLEAFRLEAPFADLEADADRVAEGLKAACFASWDSEAFDGIDMLLPVFYRNKGAYLIGRVRRLNRVIPFILPLLQTDDGVRIDAALLGESDASRLFSFTRSYFHVEWDNQGELIGFLKSILPMKPIAELYTAIGYNQHGKTALFRAFYRHLEHSTGRFEVARGTKGMVMAVFTLPSFDVVFKIIRDRFAPPKQTTRDEVMGRYKLVFRHDRVGRMVDAQEFENLAFSIDRFTDDLLDELLTECANTVEVHDDQVVIKHLYTERRLYPLDLYLREMGTTRARAAVIEYGNAIKDLAAADIFPGDLFAKNFGVTRHGNVVFYDYDELALLSECNFREIPESQHPEDEMSSTPWFSVAPNDVFPEEFATFMWFPKDLWPVMREYHGDLFTTDYWRGMQAQLIQGELPDFYPYPDELRFSYVPPAPTEPNG